ncbi:MAG: ABC transporter ATP-binding protein [Clostridiales bacterium]|jgi:ABC-type multidrug transport system fused ATPase/permease subunit|nr:ABC transporter ATP-binding protein [Clostridiales bacterium]
MNIYSVILKKRLFWVIASLGTSGLTAAAALWWNVQLREIIDRISVGEKFSAHALTWALIAIAVTAVTNYLKGCVAGFTCESMAHDLRMGYARHFTALSFAESENINAGEQLSKLQNEIAEVNRYINSNLFQLFDDGVNFAVTFIWLIFINPVLTAAVYLPELLILCYVFYSSRIIRATTERSQQAKGQMNRCAETMLTLFPVIRLYGAEQMLFNRYSDSVKIWEGAAVCSERTRARLMSPSGLFSTSIPLLILFGVGGGMVIKGVIFIGTLYIFVNLSGNISRVLMNMPGYFAAFRQFSANIKRITPYVLIEGRAK